MLQPDLRELLYDEDIGGGRVFTIIRRSKVRSKGRLTDGQTETITAVGSVQPLGADSLCSNCLSLTERGRLSLPEQRRDADWEARAIQVTCLRMKLSTTGTDSRFFN